MLEDNVNDKPLIVLKNSHSISIQILFWAKVKNLLASNKSNKNNVALLFGLEILSCVIHLQCKLPWYVGNAIVLSKFPHVRFSL